MFILKWFRVLIAIVMFAALMFLFIDISAIAPLSLHYLAELQFVQLLLRGGLIGLTGVFVLLFVTIIFGRCYCSMICPYGILQDFISRVAKLFYGKKHKYSYRPARQKIRNLIFVLFIAGVVIMTFFSTAVIVILLDPYSNFGRIAFSIFQPINIFINNLLVSVNDFIGNNKDIFQPRAIPLFDVSFIISAVMFLLVMFLSFFYGRRYCNMICPVGTLLGFVANFSLFRVKLDRSKCIKCGLCEKICKGECINSKSCIVDSSRCVTCFNCFSVCRKNAISYLSISLVSMNKNKNEIAKENKNEITNKNTNENSKENKNKNTKEIKPKSNADLSTIEIQHGRRRFLRLSFLSLLFSSIGGGAMQSDDPYGIDPYNANSNSTDNKDDKTDSELNVKSEQLVSDTAGEKTAVIETKSDVNSSVLNLEDNIDKASRVSYVNDTIILPPGAKSLKNFQSKCTSCHLCVSKCPSRVLQPGTLGNNRNVGGSSNGGIAGLVQPSLQFDYHYCNKNCTVCGDVCPSHAIESVTAAERELLRIGIVNFVKENCIVYTQETSCGACQEHCSNGAIKMIPYGDPSKNLTIPELHAEFCIGCGGCESICPVRPYRAIYIKGVTVQTNAELSYDPNEKQQTIELDFI
ncbi:MAG: 4Fe-4S dicluster domain-containing protein [Planctomycetaceae bacterium]|jgi:formate hydrogenlyase subunit 6/NADH:ubiquinone oxidoreductase subunit I|nr:4Fe-4S dicluster domain-containing protein [Planctomycetaceae bacterium]